MAQLRGWYEKMCTVHTVVEDVGIVIRVVVMMKGIAASILNVNGGGGVREWAAFGIWYGNGNMSGQQKLC